MKMGCSNAKIAGQADFPHRIVVVNGVTAVGKSTLYKNLLKRERYTGVFKFSVSHTTRKPRPGEEDGAHYHFVSSAEFEEMIQRGEFLEHTMINGNHYGTSFNAIRDVLQSTNAFLDIDYKGMVNLKKAELPQKALYLLIVPPDESTFVQRLRDRGTETEEQIQTRIQTAHEEMAFYAENGKEYDAKIVNDDLEKATDDLDAVVWKFLSCEKAWE